MSGARDEKQLDLCEYDVKSGQSKILWQSEGAYALASVSQDHQRFVVSETKSDANNDLYLVERSKPAAKKLLTQHTGDVLTDANFTHDGRTLLLTSDERGENRALYALDIATGKKIVAHEEAWDVEGSSESRTGKYRLTGVNVEGAPQLSVVEVKTGKTIALPAAPAGLAWDAVDYTRSGAFVIGFSKSERYLGVVARGDTAPPVPYVLDLAKGTATPVSDTLPPTLHDHAMITATSVRIASSDGQAHPGARLHAAGRRPLPCRHRRARRPYGAKQTRFFDHSPVPPEQRVCRPGAQRARVDGLRQIVDAA